MTCEAELEFHPLAECFPLLEGDEFIGLVNSIKANGLREPVITFEGKILDGRNRYRACLAAGVEPHFKSFMEIGGDPIVFVIDDNLRRRHLTPEQRRELIIRLIAMQPEKSDRQIAEVVKVDHKTVAAARKKGEDVGRIPHVEKRKDSKGRRQPARKTAKKPPAPPAEVETTPPADDAEASAAKRKAENAARDEAARESTDETGKPADTALRDFDGPISWLLQMTGKAKPEQFAKTSVHADELVLLGEFLLKVASAKRASGKRTPAPKAKHPPAQSRDPLKVDWHRLDADDLEAAIREAQRYGVDHEDEGHEHKQKRLRQLPLMSKRLTELRATERAVEEAAHKQNVAQSGQLGLDQGKAPVARPDLSIPQDLSIPESLKRRPPPEPAS